MFSGNGQKCLINLEYSSSARITENIIFLAQPKISVSTPDSLEQRFKAFERKWSLVAPEVCLCLIYCLVQDTLN